MRRNAPLALVASLAIAATMIVATPAAADSTTAGVAPTSAPRSLAPAALAEPDEPSALTPVAPAAPDGPTVAELAAGDVLRLAGLDRYATAIEVSKIYDPGVPAVFVATGTNFPDALSAASAAALFGGPLLLTPTAALPQAVYDEIDRLQPEVIAVIGRAPVVSDAVVKKLQTLAPTVRLGGIDRYATGLAVVQSTFEWATDAVIATGRTFPDALSATGAAGAIGAPVILVDGTQSRVSQAVLDTLRELGVERVHIAGSAGAVSSGIQSHLSSAGFAVARYGGADRYQTAAIVNDAFFPAGSTDTIFLATGTNFPDALSGAALAGAVGAPLYITAPGCVPDAVRDSVSALGATLAVVMGGTSVVSDAAAANYGCLDPAIPTISGTPKAAHTLTANPGAWTPGASMSYVWYANGSPLGGGETLPLTEWLVGKRITVSVTASLEGYVSATRTSQPTAPIASAIEQSPHYPNAVTAGAYCAKQYEGWYAHTSTGVRVKCMTSPTDSRLRWRAI